MSQVSQPATWGVNKLQLGDTQQDSCILRPVSLKKMGKQQFLIKLLSNAEKKLVCSPPAAECMETVPPQADASHFL